MPTLPCTRQWWAEPTLHWMESSRTFLEISREPSDLGARTADWENLANAASEINPFYESWMVAAALEHLEADDVRVAFVYANETGAQDGRNGHHPNTQSHDALIGVFPLQAAKRYKGLPLAHWKLWKHDYCFLCTPLVRAGCETAALEGLIRGLRNLDGPGLIEFGFVGADGPVFDALGKVLEQENAAALTTDQFERATLDTPASYDAYFRETFDGKRRKELTRQSNRLAERGTVAVDGLQASAPPDGWIDDFLRLEASGWKGKEQTAFSSNDGDRAFFRVIATEAHRRNRLMMLALRVDEKPIAMKFNMLAGDAAFAFKIAFDEEWSAYSPGMRLELENVRALCDQQRVKWLDGCADAEHFMANRIWPQRRKMASVLVALRATGAAAIRGLQLARGIRKRFGGGKPSERGVPS